MLRPLMFAVCCYTALAGCKKEVCGEGLIVDTRPLSDAWAKNWEAPPGSTACSSKDAEYGDTQRHYVVPADSTKEAVVAWERALTSKGWKKQAPTKADLDSAMRNDCSHGASYLHDDGYYIGVSVSSCAEGTPGWSTVIFRPKTESERSR